MGRAGVARDSAERVLGIYDQHLYEGDKRRALALWVRYLKGLEMFM